MGIGENIKNRRIRSGQTQEEFATRIGVGRSMVAQIERGSKVPSMILGHEIARALDCSMEELMEGGIN